MRSVIAAAWFFGLGWYVRATGLDEDLGKILLDGYKLAVQHTVKIAADTRQLQHQDARPLEDAA